MRFEYLFFVALVLYTLVIWAHKLGRKLSVRMVLIFGTALTADTTATFFACMAHAKSWQLNFHAITGLASLLIMALHFFWALLAISAGGKFGRYFGKFSIYAWLLWLAAFVSGIPFPHLKL